MKKVNKLLALLLALVMVFCLAACGTDSEGDNDDKADKNNSSVENKDDKDDSSADKDKDKDDSSADKDDESDTEKVLGEWICRFDLSDAMGDLLAEQLGDDSFVPDTSIYMNLTMDFDDGEFTLCAEVDEDSLVDYKDDLCDSMIDYLYDLAEEEGMSGEELEDTIEQENGMTLEEYVEDQLGQSIEATADVNFEISAYYELDEDEGCIYIGGDEDELDSKEEAMMYSFSGSKLSITGMISDGEELDDPVGLESFGIEMPWEFEKK